MTQQCKALITKARASTNFESISLFRNVSPFSLSQKLILMQSYEETPFSYYDCNTYTIVQQAFAKIHAQC